MNCELSCCPAGILHPDWRLWCNSADSFLVVGIGGGGDAISALPTVWALENLGKKVVILNVHTADHPNSLRKVAVENFGKSCFRLGCRPANETRARFSELDVEKITGIRCFTGIVNHGAKALSDSINKLIDATGCGGVACVDSGTDSLAGSDTKITSILTDAISLAAVSSLTKNWFPLCVIGCIADLEMSLEQFVTRTSFAQRLNGFCGVINWNYQKANWFNAVLNEAKRHHPFSVSETISKAAISEIDKWINPYGQVIPVNPLQILTFVFSAKFVISEINPFVQLCHNLDFNLARANVCSWLRSHHPSKRKWDDEIMD